MLENKNYSKEYKFKVVLEMLKGDLSLAEIISKYQVPRSVVQRWKKQFLDNGSEIFNSAKNNSLPSNGNHEIDKLHATIGKLKVENDFLHQVSAKLKL